MPAALSRSSSWSGHDILVPTDPDDPVGQLPPPGMDRRLMGGREAWAATTGGAAAVTGGTR
jgi:hypothetical protein